MGKEIERLQNLQAETQHTGHQQINKGMHQSGARVKYFILGFFSFIKALRIKIALDKLVKKAKENAGRDKRGI